MPGPFNTVPPVVVALNHKVILLLLHNCSFATVMNRNTNIFYAGDLIRNPHGACNPQDEKHYSRQFCHFKSFLPSSYRREFSSWTLVTSEKVHSDKLDGM